MSIIGKQTIVTLSNIMTITIVMVESALLLRLQNIHEDTHHKCHKCM